MSNPSEPWLSLLSSIALVDYYSTTTATATALLLLLLLLLLLRLRLLLLLLLLLLQQYTVTCCPGRSATPTSAPPCPAGTVPEGTR